MAEVDPVTGYADTPSGYEPGREPDSLYWQGPAGDEWRRLERLALEELVLRHLLSCGYADDHRRRTSAPAPHP